MTKNCELSERHCLEDARERTEGQIPYDAPTMNMQTECTEEHRSPHEPKHPGEHRPPHPHELPPHHPHMAGGPPVPPHGRLRFRPEEILKQAQNAQPLELLDMCHRELHRPESGGARGQMRAARILAERGEMSQRELQDMLRIQPASVSELLSKLERKGYICREPGEDRRANILKITEAGREIALKYEITAEDELLSSLSAEQREQLTFLLRTLLTDWITRSASD